MLRFLQNGPIVVNSDYSLRPNNYSWHNLADYFWIDQPM
jgi:carboxypeptidase D